MADQEKAPSVNDVRNKEQIKEKKIISKENKQGEKTIQKQKERAEKQDAKKAKEIIDALKKMFKEGLVSSKKGCFIPAFSVDECNENVLKKVNDYLDGEWLATFKSGPNDPWYDLIIKPII
jgi:hypothetical protein